VLSVAAFVVTHGGDGIASSREAPPAAAKITPAAQPEPVALATPAASGPERPQPEPQAEAKPVLPARAQEREKSSAGQELSPEDRDLLARLDALDAELRELTNWWTPKTLKYFASLEPPRREGWERLACEVRARAIKPLSGSDDVRANYKRQQKKERFEKNFWGSMVLSGFKKEGDPRPESMTIYGPIPPGITCPERILRELVGNRYFEEYTRYLVEQQSRPDTLESDADAP
jgi:hypothetical protein